MTPNLGPKRGPKGPKCPYNGQIRAKWAKMAQIGPKCPYNDLPYWPNWPNMAKMAQIDPIWPKCHYNGVRRMALI